MDHPAVLVVIQPNRWIPSQAKGWKYWFPKNPTAARLPVTLNAIRVSSGGLFHNVRNLSEDPPCTKRTIAALDGPVILVGHSYGGAVITEAGNDPKVFGLVYIIAVAPDKGESVSSLIKDPPPGAPVPPILPPQDGYLFLDRAKFPAAFAADVSPDAASFMADSQVPWGLEALGGAIIQPAWRTKPSWYLVSTDDKMIPPDAQRAMSKRAGSTVVEVKGSHAVYVSQPQAVAHFIEQAATGAFAAGREKAAGGVSAAQ